MQILQCKENEIKRGLSGWMVGRWELEASYKSCQLGAEQKLASDVALSAKSIFARGTENLGRVCPLV